MFRHLEKPRYYLIFLFLFTKTSCDLVVKTQNVDRQNILIPTAVLLIFIKPTIITLG